MAERLCLGPGCNKNIEHKIASAKYCSNACLKRHKRSQKKAMSLGQKEGVIAKEYVQARDVILNNVDDEVRDVLREEVRASISERVKENVAGAADALTALLPQAIAVFAEDLQSKDWMKRNKAALAVTKLAFPLGQEEANRKDNSQVVIVHNVPLPDTTLGHRVAEHLEEALVAEPRGLMNPDLPYDAETNPEVFEVNYPLCARCHERKHPDMIRTQTSGTNLCTTCLYRERIMKRDGDGLGADIDRELW